MADAVVKQVLSGKGKQLIIGAEIGWLSGLRAWPHWVAQTFIHLSDGQVVLAEVGTEKTGG